MAIQSKKLYDILSKDKNYSGVGESLEDFRSYFSQDSNAQRLYDALSKDKKYAGVGESLDDFRDYFGLKKKDGLPEPAKPSPDSSAASPTDSTGTSPVRTVTSASGASGSTAVAPPAKKKIITQFPNQPTQGEPSETAKMNNMFFNDKPAFYDRRNVAESTAQTSREEIAKRGFISASKEAAEIDRSLDELKRGASPDVFENNKALERAAEKRRTEMTLGVMADKGQRLTDEDIKAIDQKTEAERKEFTNRFYGATLSGDDIRTLKNANPLVKKQWYSTDDDDQTADLINTKTNNLKQYAEAVRGKGAMEFGKTRRELKERNADVDERIALLEGENFIYMEDGKYKSTNADHQFQADEANKLVQERIDNDAKLSSITKQFEKNEYADDYKEFIRLRDQKISEMHGGKSLKEIMRLADAGKDTGGFIKLGEDGKLSKESAEAMSKLVDDVITDNKLTAMQVFTHDDDLKVRGNYKKDYVREYENSLNDMNYGVRALIEEEDGLKEFMNTDEGKNLKPYFDSYSKINELFSTDKVKQFEAGLRASQDAAQIAATKKWNDQIQTLPEYLSIVSKWQKNVYDNLITQQQADEQMRREVEQNPALKKYAEQRDNEIKGAYQQANKQREKFMLENIASIGDNNLTIYDDGTVGLKSMSKEQFAEGMKNMNSFVYESGVNLVPSAVQRREAMAADVRNNVEAIMMGAGTSAFKNAAMEAGNRMMKQTFRWLYHKTGVGLDAMRYFQAGQETDITNVGEYAQEHFRYKGLESLLDPAFYGSAAGQSAPYMLPAMALGMATGGVAGGAIAGAGARLLETGQNALATYDDVYTTGIDKYGGRASEADASRAAANNFSHEVLPNMVFGALEFGTLLRAGAAVKPAFTIRALAEGVGESLGAAVGEGVEEGVQGYVQMNARRYGEGRKPMDVWDYMQDEDFRQNFFMGMAGGLGMGGALKAKGILNTMKQWDNIVQTGNRELASNAIYSAALDAERKGYGDAHRDMLRLRLDNHQYENEHERAMLERSLAYSEHMSSALKDGVVNLDDRYGQYAAHSLGMAGMYDEMAENAKKDGKATAKSKVYEGLAEQYRSQSAEAMEGTPKIYYAETEDGHPIFLSEQSAKALVQQGLVATWKKDGLVSDMKSEGDNEFNEMVRNQDVAQAEKPSTAEEAPPAVTETGEVVQETAEEKEAREKAENARKEDNEFFGEELQKEEEKVFEPNKIFYFGDENEKGTVVDVSEEGVSILFEGETEPVLFSHEAAMEELHERPEVAPEQKQEEKKAETEESRKPTYEEQMAERRRLAQAGITEEEVKPSELTQDEKVRLHNESIQKRNQLAEQLKQTTDPAEQQRLRDQINDLSRQRRALWEGKVTDQNTVVLSSMTEGGEPVISFLELEPAYERGVEQEEKKPDWSPYSFERDGKKFTATFQQEDGKYYVDITDESGQRHDLLDEDGLPVEDVSDRDDFVSFLDDRMRKVGTLALESDNRVLRPTKRKYNRETNDYNFTYHGKQYRISFHQEENEDNGWFADVSSDEGNFYLTDADGLKMDNYKTKKAFIEDIEQSAKTNWLGIRNEETRPYDPDNIDDSKESKPLPAKEKEVTPEVTPEVAPATTTTEEEKEETKPEEKGGETTNRWAEKERLNYDDHIEYKEARYRVSDKRGNWLGSYNTEERARARVDEFNEELKKDNVGEMKVAKGVEGDIVNDDIEYRKQRPDLFRSHKIYAQDGTHIGTLVAHNLDDTQAKTSHVWDYEVFLPDGRSVHIERGGYVHGTEEEYTQRHALDALRKHYKEHAYELNSLRSKDMHTITKEQYRSRNGIAFLDSWKDGDLVEGTLYGKKVVGRFYSDGHKVVIGNEAHNVINFLWDDGSTITNKTMNQTDAKRESDRKARKASENKILAEAKNINDAYWDDKSPLSVLEGYKAVDSFFKRHGALLSLLDESLYENMANIVEGAINKYTKTDLAKTKLGTISAKIEMWAQQLERAGSGLTFSVPIPITPKQLARALRFVARSMERGVELAKALENGVKYIKRYFDTDTTVDALESALREEGITSTGLTYDNEQQLFREVDKRLQKGMSFDQAYDEASREYNQKVNEEHLNQQAQMGATNITPSPQSIQAHMRDAVRDRYLNKKPVRMENESIANYANRVLRWRNTAKQEGTQAQAATATAASKVEYDFIERLNEGIALLQNSAVELDNDQYNQKLGLPQGDTQHYLAALKYLQSSNKKAANLLQTMRISNPKIIAMEELKLLRLQMQAWSRGYQEHTNEQRDALRSEVKEMLKAYNEIGAFAGVKYTAQELTTAARMVNNIYNKEGLSDLFVFFQNLMDKANYIRTMDEVGKLMNTAKKLLRNVKTNKNIIPIGSVPILRELVGLNPRYVSDIDMHLAWLKDAFETKKGSKDAGRPSMDNNKIRAYVDQQKQHRLSLYGDEMLSKYNAFLNSAAFKTLAKEGKFSNLPTYDQLKATVQDWQTNPVHGSHEQVMDMFKGLEDQLNWMVRDSKEKMRQIKKNNIPVGSVSVLNYKDIPSLMAAAQAASANQQQGAKTGKARDELETMAKAMQTGLTTSASTYGLSAEAQAALDKMAKMDVTGMGANQLRYFMNVIDNITLNDDLSGYKYFEVKADAQQQVSAWQQFLKDTNYIVRKAVKRGKLRRGLHEVKSEFESTEQAIWDVSDGATKLAVQIYQTLGYDALKSKYKQMLDFMQHKVADRMNKLFEEKGLEQSAETNIRLTLYSRLNQNQSDDAAENQAMFTKRLMDIRDDMNVKQKSESNRDEYDLIRIEFGKLRDLILRRTGVDIEADTVEGLDASVLDKIGFLSPVEQEAYQIYRDAYEELKPDFIALSEGLLGKEFDEWNNYMGDSYRKLGGGIITDTINPKNFGVGVFNQNQMKAETSGSFNQRVQGATINPVVGEDTRVINYNWFMGQWQNTNDMAYDIHTLEERTKAHEVLSDASFFDSVGETKHKVLLKAMERELTAMTGASSVQSTALHRNIKVVTNLLGEIASKRQLLSVSSYFKQAWSAWANTAAFLGKDKAVNLSKAKNLLEDQFTGFIRGKNKNASAGLVRLLQQFDISLRGETNAGTNIYRDKNIHDLNMKMRDSWTGKKFKQLTDWYRGEKDVTGEKRTRMDYFIKVGDVVGAQSSWTALYAKYLEDNGLVKDFDSVDWEKEADSPNRAAAAYASLVTSKQLNVNSTTSHGAFTHDRNAGSAILRSMYALFASFGFNKSVGMINNFSTIAMVKNNEVSAEQRKDELNHAWRSLAGGLAEETAFQSIKWLGVRGIIGYGVYAAMAALTGDDELKKRLKERGKITKESFQTMLASLASNYLFSIVGNQGQEILSHASNTVIDGLVGKKPFFEAPSNPNRPSASPLFTAGFGETWTDLDRFYDLAFKNTSYKGNPVGDPTKEELAWSLISLTSEMASGAGFWDADINRMIQKRVQMYDYEISKRYEKPYWISSEAMGGAPDHLQLHDHAWNLTEEQGKFYYDQRKEYLKSVENRVFYRDEQKDKEEKSRRATDYAKKMLWREYSQDIKANGRYKKGE